MNKEGADTPEAPGPTATPTDQDVFAAVEGADEVSPSNDAADPAPEQPSEGNTRPKAEVDVPKVPEAVPGMQSTPAPTPVSSLENAVPKAPETPKVETPVEPAPSLEETPAAPQQLTQEQLQKFQQDALVQLSQQYALDPATLAEIEEKGVHAVLPRLMANAHIKMLNSVMHLMQNQVPQQFRQLYTSETAKRAFTNKFFKEWPGLSKKEHVPVVREILQRTRALDPSMSMDDLIETVGSLASRKLKLPVQRGGQPAGQAVSPATPSPAFTPSASAARPTAPAPAARAPGAGPNWAELVEDDA